eukprot:3964917-Amphidinium_carterae.1
MKQAVVCNQREKLASPRPLPSVRIHHNWENSLFIAYEVNGQLALSSTRQPLHDVRVVLLSDGCPREAYGGVWSGGHKDGKEAVISTLQKELLRHQPKGRLQQLIIYTVGFGAQRDEFKKYLKPLSDFTGGTFHVASLHAVDLTQMVTTVASSITVSRTCSSSKRAQVESPALAEEEHYTCEVAK